MPTHIFRAVARGSYLRNSCNYLNEAKAVVEAFDSIVHKHPERFKYQADETS